MYILKLSQLTNRHMKFFIIVFIVTISGCSKSGGEGFYYSNGFNNPTDLLGFSGYAYDLTAESMEGDSSLLVSGGCVGEHGGFTIPVDQASSIYRIRISGVSMDYGGGVSFSDSSNPENRTYISFTEKHWQTLTAEIELEQGSDINVQFMSGGIVESKTLFDNLIIEELD